MKMKLKLQGIWHVKHIRNGEVLNEFDTHNAITRRGAWDIMQRLWQFFGNNGGLPVTDIVPEIEGSQIEDFLSMGRWEVWMIEQEGDGILGLGGDYDSGRGVHRDDRVHYWRQNTAKLDTVPPRNDNREWDGDGRQIAGLVFTHYNDGTPMPPPPSANLPRNMDSIEAHITYRADQKELWRGIWMKQQRSASIVPGKIFGQQSVVSSTAFVEPLAMQPFDFLELIYKVAFVHTIAT